MTSQAVTQTEEAQLTRRLLSSLPTSRFEMHTLTRLTAIKASRKLSTAAVECAQHPRLLINPDFVGKHCPRDEHLFLLVMHELWHVLLAHTRMQPIMTPAHNIAFDAVINANLMQEFNQPEYMGFFDAFYPADEFPHCLLRPPVGWPLKAQYPDVGPEGTRQMLMRLYPPFNIRRHAMPLYEELLALLIKGGVSALPEGLMLIGSHDGPIRPIHDPVMKEILSHITANWPRIPGKGWGNGGRVDERTVTITDSSEDTRRVFSRVLRRALGRRRGNERRHSNEAVPVDGGNGVLPNARDRLAAARHALGAPKTLWSQPTSTRARLPVKPSRAFIYLDVSGSMNQLLGHLMHLLLPYLARGEAEAFQFSTVVKPLPFSQLRQGKLSTSGGTSINCVLNHLLEVTPAVQRTLLITDGMVGAANSVVAEEIRERGIQLYVVLPHGRQLSPGVQELAAGVVNLPPLRT